MHKKTRFGGFFYGGLRRLYAEPDERAVFYMLLYLMQEYMHK
jgi:hypothetical protein